MVVFLLESRNYMCRDPLVDLYSSLINLLTEVVHGYWTTVHSY